MTQPLLRKVAPNSAYALSAFVGGLTYTAYAALNDAWANAALIAIALFLFLSTPLYSKYSNRIEVAAARMTSLETGGRIARYLFQLLDNLILLTVFVAGRVIEQDGLEAIGGFFATAAWITVASQGAQYLANGLARRGLGQADRNVVVAFTVSAVVSALAVSGVSWVQPLFVAFSLLCGVWIFGFGILTDAGRLLDRHKSWRRSSPVS